MVWHIATSGIHKRPVRKWKISPPHPQAQYSVSITVEYVEPRKRRSTCNAIDPDNRTI